MVLPNWYSKVMEWFPGSWHIVHPCTTSVMSCHLCFSATTSPLSSVYSLLRSILVAALVYGFCLGAINVSGNLFVSFTAELCLLVLPLLIICVCVCVGSVGRGTCPGALLCVLRPPPGLVVSSEQAEQRPNHPLVSVTTHSWFSSHLNAPTALWLTSKLLCFFYTVLWTGLWSAPSSSQSWRAEHQKSPH